jgi:hypothetical protein
MFICIFNLKFNLMKKQDFFDKEEKKVLDISEFTEFNHNEESDTKACGLNPKSSTFNDRNDVFFAELKDMFSGKNSGNPVSCTAECLEKNFSTREISFLLAKSIITESITTRGEE